MAEKLQSKVKLRSGEVVTIDHVKPSKRTTKAEETKTPKEPTTPPKDDEETTTQPEGDESKTPKTDETKQPNTQPKETK